MGKAYRLSFKINDLWDLKKKINEHSGSYLVNLSMNDPEMIEIFGNRLELPTTTGQPPKVPMKMGIGGVGILAEILELLNITMIFEL